MARRTTFPAPGSARMRQALRPVSRPHPIRRLIDGRPDDPGRRIARRTTLLMIPAIVGANFTGAVVVMGHVEGQGEQGAFRRAAIWTWRLSGGRAVQLRVADMGEVRG